VTLQDLGNVGEFLGAVAVLVSLIYLALQIRQNTTTVRAGTSAAISESLARVTEIAGSDPRTARLWTLGIAGDQSLDAEDELQFALLFASYMRRLENAYFQQFRGFVDLEHWQTTERMLSTLMKFPGASRRWETLRGVHSDRFVAYVDGFLAERGADPPAAQQGNEPDVE
jgi:hypothetical protein